MRSKIILRCLNTSIPKCLFVFIKVDAIYSFVDNNSTEPCEKLSIVAKAKHFSGL